jgi:hypothetical protein
MQKIHVALSSLELKVFVVMDKLVTVAFVVMAISVVTRALFLMIVNVPYILVLYRVTTLVKKMLIRLHFIEAKSLV